MIYIWLNLIQKPGLRMLSSRENSICFCWISGGINNMGPFNFFNINLFIYFWLCWVFFAACRLSLVAESGGYSLLRCTGFSLRWLLLLQSTGSRHVGFSSCSSWALERRLSSCGAWASCSAACGIFPDQGSNPCPLALAGRFLTTVPPGKSLSYF